MIKSKKLNAQMAFKTRQLSIKKLALSLCWFLILLLLSGVGREGLSPLSNAFGAVLLLTGSTPLLCALFYVGAAAVFTIELRKLAAKAVFASVLLISRIIFNRYKRRARVHSTILLSLVASFFEYYQFFSLGGNVGILLTAAAISSVYILACFVSFEAAIVNIYRFKPNAAEYSALAVFIMGISMAASPFSVDGVRPVLVFTALICLVAAQYTFPALSLGVALSLSLGMALSGFEFVWIGAFALMCAVSNIFSRHSKLLTAGAFLLTNIILGYFFLIYKDYGLYEISALALGCFIFLLLPEKKMARLFEAFSINKQTTAVRTLINDERERNGAKFRDLARVFNEMGGIFIALGGGGLCARSVDALAGEVCQRVCEGCTLVNECLGELREETKAAYLEAANAALLLDECALNEVPPFFVSRCPRISTLISSLNREAQKAKHTLGKEENRDNSRALAASHMAGVGKMLEGLAFDISRPVSFDVASEKRILDELAYLSIICSEAVVYNGGKEVALVLKSQSFSKNTLAPTLSKIVKRKMELVSLLESGQAGWVIAKLKSATRFDVVFGCASVGKNNSKIIGDSHSFLSIERSKFMTALLDGMGSGESAQRTSTAAAGLIENLYRAGFNNELALSSANALLSGINSENYAAADIAVIDLNDGYADIIKIGAPSSFLKRKNSVDVISGAALPLGALDEVSPYFVKKLMLGGDFLVFCSDGISDCLEEFELANLINNTKTTNPQHLAEVVLKQCYEIDKNLPHDDMTVIAARLFERD